MQIPGALDFGGKRSVLVCGCQVLEYAFAEDHGGLDDAFDRGHRLGHIVQDMLYGGGIGEVAGGSADVDAAG